MPGKKVKTVRPRKVLWPKGKPAPKPGQRAPRSFAEKKAIAARMKTKVGKRIVSTAVKSRKRRTGRVN